MDCFSYNSIITKCVRRLTMTSVAVQSTRKQFYTDSLGDKKNVEYLFNI